MTRTEIAMKPAPLILALALIGCNRVSSPVEPLSSPTPSPTLSPVTMALWPVCEGNQPVWFVTNTGAGSTPSGSWSIAPEIGGSQAAGGALAPLGPGSTVTLDHPTVLLSGGVWTLTVQDGGSIFISSIRCNSTFF